MENSHSQILDKMRNIYFSNRNVAELVDDDVQGSASTVSFSWIF